MDAPTNSFSPEQIKMFQHLLSMGPPIMDNDTAQTQVLSESDDYTTDESESGSDEPQVTRRRGRPKKVRTPEELVAREASKARGRGRPTKARTPEELVAIEEAAADKEARRRIRSEKKHIREAEEAIKQQAREVRQAKAEQKALEKAERDAGIKAKRIATYEKMCFDADAYKAKWDL